MSEVVLEKGYDWVYFPELNQMKGIGNKLIIFLIGMYSIYASLYNKGYRKIKWVKLLNTKTGIVRIVKEKRFANSMENEQ